ncbi:thioredoxin [Candidatus Zinderia endosymbiont of Aphrophora alni]|uniref:thioredoxin n=1 Tax=Candidatus Zinderia endosymbiont of Aphrophora alni TaxID=3077951 RepID=UPI0030D21F7A
MLKIVKSVTDLSFENDILKAKRPIILDFWAPWCNPCKMVLPIFSKVALEYKNIIIFTKLNVDENSEITKIFNIKSIPTLYFFRKGIVISKRIGVFSESQLMYFIEKNVHK